MRTEVEKSVHISENLVFMYKDRQSVLKCAALKESDTLIRTQHSSHF